MTPTSCTQALRTAGVLAPRSAFTQSSSCATGRLAMPNSCGSTAHNTRSLVGHEVGGRKRTLCNPSQAAADCAQQAGCWLRYGPRLYCDQDAEEAREYSTTHKTVVTMCHPPAWRCWPS